MLTFTLPHFHLPTAVLSPIMDPAAFMDAVVNEPMETEFKLIPIAEYRAMIDDFTTENAFEAIEFERKDGTKGVMNKFNPPFVLQDDALKTLLNRDKVICRAQIILDFDDAGLLDTGVNKNVKLGQLREALNQNAPPWSFSLLRGAGPLMVKVGHRNIAKKGEPARYMAEVTDFFKIS